MAVHPKKRNNNVRFNTCLQCDRKTTGLLQESLLVSPLWLLLAPGSNPRPPMCAHPLPLLSLVQCRGLESLQAWGASLLLPSHSSTLSSAGVMST